MRTLQALLAAGALLLSAAGDARAQTASEILGFLLTNRSIPTDDFVRDTEAAETTRATIARVLQLELGSVPIASSASGFTYRLNPSLGAVERTSDSFGPMFVNRSLTLGGQQIAVSVSYRETAFDALDGRPLRDGSLVATASQLAGESVPFDVETLTLRLRTRTTAFSANMGITDRLDLGVAIPVVALSVEGERADTYRGSRSIQAVANAVVTGVSDILVRTKFNAVRRRGSGMAIGADLRLPTGDAENLLGSGEATFLPRLMGSLEGGRFAVHGDLGVRIGYATGSVDYGVAATMASTPRLTLVGELSGRRVASLGRLVDTLQPHPSLAGVQTLRLTSTDRAAHQAVATAGFKWNVFSTWLLSGHVSHPLTESGLTADWVPSLSLDYLLGR